MDANQLTASKPRPAIHSKKWAMGVTATLLSLSMILAACGGDTDTGGDTVPPADDATVATPAVDDAAVDDAAEDAVEDTADDAAATPEAAEETESSEVIDTETGVITDTDVVTTTEVITETDVMTDVDVTTITTDTVVTTETEDEGDAETLTESEVMTETEGMTETDVITETEDVDAGATTTETGATDAEAAAETDTDAAAAAAATGAGAAMGISGVEEGQYVRASTLLDYDFENLNGDVSGDLEDLLIDLSTGRVLFASIEYGGVLDLGDRDVVVPLNAFTIGEEGELVLNIDEATLENYPDVGNDWPDLNDPAWDDDVATFWSEAGIDTNLNFEEATTSVARASELMGLPAGNLAAGADAAAGAAADAEAGTELGSIQDILVDLGTARAPYLVVTYGAGLDDDPYIVPISAFDTAAWNEGLNYQADFTPDMLQDAPRFDQDTYPEGTPLDRDFGDTVESWWNDMGFSNDLNNDGQLD